MFSMNSLILLFLGVLGPVFAVYKIPKHDACVLRVLLCDDFIKPLTPVDNSTLEMFDNIRHLNAVCQELSTFRKCLKNAANFCAEHSDLDVGFELLKNRKLAFDLCSRRTGHQHVYMVVQRCVNTYSPTAIDFCTDKAVETVGLAFSLGDIESECRFLEKMQHCHIALIKDQCGNVAGSALEKLVIFRGQRDFMCIGYDKEKFKNLKAFHDTMDFYVEQYRDTHYRIIKEDGTEIIEKSKTSTALPEEFSQDRTSSKLQSRVSHISVENCATVECSRNNEHPLSPKISGSTKILSPCSCLSQKEILLLNIPQNTTEHSKIFYEQPDEQVLSDENFACETKASFLLTGIFSNGKENQLGFGEADVLFDAYSPLKDVSCAWIMNEAAPTPLFNCSIMIDDSVMVREVCERKIDCDLPFETLLAVYETRNEREVKRIGELRIHSFLKYSPTSEKSLIHFFKKHDHGIRHSCSERFAKQDQIPSTSRKGFLPSQFGMHDMTPEQSEMFGQRYNFYESEFPDYPMDTGIHLLSGNLESEIETEDPFPPQSYDGPFLSEEILSIKDLDEPFTLHPSTASRFSPHSYRPYELFRPRVGEMLHNEDQDAGMNDVPECDTSSDRLSFEDNIQKGYLDTEETCPALPENVSKFINKLDKDIYMDIAHPLGITNPDCHKKFQIYEETEDVPLKNVIWKAGESEDIGTDDGQNENVEVYTVTPSAEIETTDDLDTIGYESVQILEEGSQISNAKDYQNDKHPFLDKFVETSTNPKAIPEEEISQESKTFSKRSDEKYSIKVEEKFLNTFEILAKIKVDLGRIRKTFKETRKIKGKSKSLKKEEL